VRAAVPSGWIVRCQAPIALDDESEPEPDVAVVRGSHDDYLESHPERPALVIEVAESSLRLDRRDKGSLYARAPPDVLTPLALPSLRIAASDLLPR
jgi:Uma2 family endonuclease